MCETVYAHQNSNVRAHAHIQQRATCDLIDQIENSETTIAYMDFTVKFDDS